MKLRSTFTLLAAVGIAAAFFGCSSSTSSNNNGPTTVTPKAGSQGIYHQTVTDTIGGTAAMPTDSIVVATVMQSGMQFAGKTNVIEVVDGGSQYTMDTTQTPDTVYYNIESNGDVSYYQPNFSAYGYSIANDSVWLRFPFGSHATNDTLVKETATINFNGLPIPATVAAVANYNGSASNAANSNAPGSMATVTVYVTGTLQGVGSYTVSVAQQASYDPSIGATFHSMHTVTNPQISTSPAETRAVELSLISYTLIQ